MKLERNPKDNCVSLYKNIFEGNLNFCYTQNELAIYYNLYKDLMLFLFSYDTFEDAHKLMQNLHKNNHKSIDQEFVDKIINTIKNSM